MRCLICEQKTVCLGIEELRICNNCGLLQRTPTQIIPRENIKYNEPEDHITSIAKNLKELFYQFPIRRNVNDIIIRGLSPKDDTLLKALEKEGFNNTKRLITGSDDVAIIPNQLGSLLNNKVDLLIARHILEHSSNPRELLKKIKGIINEEGIILIEVPDNKKSLLLKDYTMPWIEHTQYYTAQTFIRALIINGFQIMKFIEIPYPLENCLIAIVKPVITNDDRGIAADYVMSLEKTKKDIKAAINNYRVGILGAGHLTETFIKLMNLEKEIKIIIDDNPDKQGKEMLGIPVKSSNEIKEINLLLIGANPINEQKIIDRLKTDKIIFKSIFPGSKRYIGFEGGN